MYNATTEDEIETRSQLLQDLFGKLGANPQISPPFYCDYGSNIYVGDNLYMNYGCVILDCNTVHLGDNLLCGPYVQIYTAYHPTDPAQRFKNIPANVIAVGNPCRVIRSANPTQPPILDV